MCGKISKWLKSRLQTTLESIDELYSLVSEPEKNRNPKITDPNIQNSRMNNILSLCGQVETSILEGYVEEMTNFVHGSINTRIRKTCRKICNRRQYRTNNE